MTTPSDEPFEPDPDAPFGAESPAFFDPGITPQEGRSLDSETMRIAERRMRVSDMYRAGMSMRLIAERVGCGLATVHNDLKVVHESLKRGARQSMADWVAAELACIAMQERAVWAEWEKSRGDYSETSTSKRDGKTPGSTASVKKRTKYGDPRLMQLMLKLRDQRAQLLGLYDKLEAAKREHPPKKGYRFVQTPVNRTYPSVIKAIGE